MSRRFRQVDVFGENSCAGNPVAVVLDADGSRRPGVAKVCRVVELVRVHLPALARVRDARAYVGVHPGAAPAAARGVRIETFQVRPDGARLAELVRLVDEGVLTLRVAETTHLRAGDPPSAAGPAGFALLLAAAALALQLATS